MPAVVVTHFAPMAPEERTVTAKRARGRRLPEFVVVRGIGRGRDYVLTFATELAALGAGLLVLRLAATYWGPAGFGEYILARRTLGMFALPVLLGMALAVTRYVAAARAGSARHNERTYVVGALGIVSGMCMATLMGFNIFSRGLAAVLFSSATYVPLVRAVSLAIVGSALHGLAYGILRGRLAMGRANTVQFVNLALVPLTSFLIPGLTPTGVITVIGALWCTVAVVALADIIAHSTPANTSWRELRDVSRELLVYGGPRVPGELALGALFALPVTIAAHMGGIVVAGHVGLAISVLSMVGSVFSPLGQILLPAISGLSARPGLLRVRASLAKLLSICLGLTACFVLVVELFTGPILRLVVGSGFAAAIPVVRTVALSAPAYVVYVVLRNVLDALHVRPLNAKNISISLCAFLLLALTLGTASSVPVSLGTAVVLLGVLSAWDAHRLLRANRASLSARQGWAA
ncbi:MAG TPA: oligosaccharide flippase family protein [Acidobacteriaceae bacterium]|nr:oligosaccharide flippase family protein [Acidobacteriaceae bacterium]